MTAAKSINAQGTVLKIADTATPTVFVAVAEVKSIGEIGGANAVIDATTLDSIAKEKKVGLSDYGQMTLGLHYDPTDTTGQDVMRTALGDRLIRNFKIEIPSVASPLTFSGYVIAFKVGSFEVDGIIGASATIEISGEVDGW